MIDLPEFNNKKLLNQAFIHRSYLNESRQELESNERLEFLGDAIISFVVSNYMYKKYPEFDEGKLTNLRSLLVNKKSLANIAKLLNFGDLLKLSKGEEESKGRQNQSLLADCFEAFIGALFLDQGIAPAELFLSKVLLPSADSFVNKNAFKDPKSLLQEFVQAQKKSSPTYKVMKEEGPAHAKSFIVGVYIQNQLVGKGLGKSKQEAEEKAATEAIEKIEKK
ncbi:MAG: ribonuclease III [Patescibacteria group bacterium]|nr:ribonuclease III [Patescibacteria group bacterium]